MAPHSKLAEDCVNKKDCESYRSSVWKGITLIATLLCGLLVGIGWCITSARASNESSANVARELEGHAKAQDAERDWLKTTLEEIKRDIRTMRDRTSGTKVPSNSTVQNEK